MLNRQADLEDLIGTPRKVGRPPKPPPEAGSVPAQIEEARLRRMLADAEKTELETARRRGELLDAGAVEREWAGILRDIRAAMLAIPGRLAAHLDKPQTALLEREIRAALSGVADDA